MVATANCTTHSVTLLVLYDAVVSGGVHMRSLTLSHEGTPLQGERHSETLSADRRQFKSFNAYDMSWNYDYIYSWQMGFEINGAVTRHTNRAVNRHGRRTELLLAHGCGTNIHHLSPCLQWFGARPMRFAAWDFAKFVAFCEFSMGRFVLCDRYPDRLYTPPS